MTTPARLKYENTNNNTEIIGVYQPSDTTKGNISTFTIEEDARGYNRVIIEGEPDLQRKMPVKKSEFGSSEREIIVEVDKNKDGTWEKRARVYPEGSGSTDDQGRYKHKNLWDFKRETGEDDVAVGTSSAITTDIEEVLNKALPSGYTVVYPSDRTPPSVNEFTYEGSRQQLYSDLQEDYEHFIIFTPFTDSNGDIEVKLQPQGYGGTQFSLVRGQDPMVYDYFKPRDTSTVISKVKIVGTTPSGDKVNKSFTPADYNDLSSADKDRFVRRRIDFLGGTLSEAESEAKSIAKNILQPNAITTLALDTSLRVDSNLNQSVGIIDDSRNVDENNTLDDEFTVVKQKDFLHEDMTYLSFEFENESTAEQRRKWREHDGQQAKIYPSKDQDVGNQNINTDTDSESSDLSRTQDVTTSASKNPSKYNIQRDSGTGVQGVETEQGYFFGNYSESIISDNGSGWQPANTGLTLGTSYDYLFHACHVSIVCEFNPSAGQTATMDLYVRLYNSTKNEYFPSSSGIRVLGTGGLHLDGGDYQHIAPAAYLHAPFNWVGDDYQLEYDIDVGGGPTIIDMVYCYHGSRGHIHDDDIEVEDDEFNAQKPSVVWDTDPSASITSQPVYTDNGHFHVIDTTTDPKSISLVEVNKTDR